MCGITALDFDHVKQLGHTLGEIAWHKAGIFKACMPVVIKIISKICLLL